MSASAKAPTTKRYKSSIANFYEKEKEKKMEKTLFDQLNSINVSEHTEKRKNGSTELTYLSWSWAWAEFKKKCPNAKYEIKMFDGKPFVYDEKTGYMVFTSVTVDDITHDMWLPVMDGANKAMKSEPYTYKTYSGEKTVAPATMFDINKAIMRCLVKNLAMFGLGLYIYSGEDLPEPTNEKQPETKIVNVQQITKDQIEMIRTLKVKEKDLCVYFKVANITDLTFEQAEQVIKLKMKNIKKGA